MKYMTLTVKQFIENIRKNGLPQARTYLFAFDYPEGILGTNNLAYEKGRTIVAACAFGQGLINSKAYIDPDDSEDGLLENLYIVTWELNDIERLTCEQIADRLEQEFNSYLEENIVLESFDYTPFLQEKVS